MHSGFITGDVGYKLLGRLGRHIVEAERGPDLVYSGGAKLTALFGEDIWAEVSGKTILDFGCGRGKEAIEMARHGARHVVGLDYRQRVLDMAIAEAAEAGVSERCEFTKVAIGQFDLIFSIDGFEHYDDPAGVLTYLRTLVKPDGRVLICFGPPWFHPYGGHLFSVFPWAHLIFTEKALMRWRADFKSDGATKFGEVEGGLNQMTVGHFERLVHESAFCLEKFEAVPIRKLRRLSNPLTREFVTSVVRCTLRPKSGVAAPPFDIE